MRILVLDGNQNSAVACVRSLVRAGHCVWVGASSSLPKAGLSRGCKGSFRYPGREQGMEAFAKCIAAQVRRVGGTLVLTMTDRNTLALSAHRDLISSAGARLALPAHAIVLRAFDKLQVTRLAESLGIAVPQTNWVEQGAQAEQLADSLHYPVVLKPSRSEELSSTGRIRKTGSPLYARNRHEFLRAHVRLSRRCASFLVQEFVHGTGAGYSALMREGELRAEFAHRRIREVLPTGSGSAVRVSIPPTPELRSAALSILEALKWHGVAMVEFRIRPDGTPVLLEINGRFWGSLALAVYSGMDFPTLLARMVSDGDVTAPSAYRTGICSRWLVGDFRHLLYVLRGAPSGFPENYPSRLSTLARFFVPQSGTFHDNFTWRDPLPELGDWLDFLVRQLPSALRKTRIDDAALVEQLNAQGRYSRS